MPKAAATPCTQPGCSTLVRSRSSRCDKHAKQEARGNSNSRGYDSQWRKLSLRYRQANPLCASHLERGQYVPGVLVDHVVPVHIAPSKRLDESNLQSLCRDCHATKTEQDKAMYGSASSPLTRAHRKKMASQEGVGG